MPYCRCTLTNGFPRVSGDEPWDTKFCFTADEFSPRERG